MKISLGTNANTKRYPESCLGILHPKGASDMGTLGWWLQQETVVDTNHELEGDHKHLAKGVCLHQRTVAGSSYWEVTGSQNNAKRREKKSEPRNPTQRAWAPAHIRTCEWGRPFPSRVFSSSSWVWGGEGNLPAEDQEEKRRFCRLLAPASPGLVKGNNSDRKSSQIKWDFYTIIFHGVCKTDLRECNTKSNRNKIISCVYSNEFSTQK